MSKATQVFRDLELMTHLGPDVLLLRRMTGSETLGQGFRYQLELLSTDPGIDFSEVLGEPASVRLSLAEGARGRERFFHGVVSDFVQIDSADLRYARYEMTLRPWLWFLTRTSDCRIFQGRTVPEIVGAVFQELGFSDFEERLSGTYAEREYCVQYRETDFDFVSRLLEEEGIYYFFEHEEHRHTMILADDNHGLDSLGTIPYSADVNLGPGKAESIFGWRLQQQLQAGRYVLNDYDFEGPKKSLLSLSTHERPHAGADYELYDYPGRYQVSAEGEHYSRRRIEELHAQFERITGSSNARSLRAGVLFELRRHPREDQNKTFLVTDIEYQIASTEFEMGSGSRLDRPFLCRVTALDAQQPFRPERITPRPVIQGPQAAVVTGPPDDEIYTDEHGRVKCQFHWDRYGERDENSSCWIRVSQMWAGKQWGAMAVPRIGQEVIVDFLEGDPDRPIITGRVYNGEQKPPYTLPANKTQTGIKSRSTQYGGVDTFNEFRFEDKKGKEQVFLQAERNQDVRVKNDAFEWIGNQRHLIVAKDQFEQVDGAKHGLVKGDQFQQVEGDRHLQVEGDRFEQVKGNQHLSVDGDRFEQVKGRAHLTVTNDQNQSVGGTLSIKVDGDIQEKVGGNHALESGMQIHLKGGMTVVIEAGAQLTLKVGGNFVTIDSAGVSIVGTMVKINSGGAAGSGSGSSPTAPTAPAVPKEPTAPEEAKDTEE